MVALQIRDVPQEVRQALAARARSNGQSLQAFLLSLVTEEARRQGNTALLERFAGRSDGSNLTSEAIVEAISQGREERDAQLSEAVSRAPNDAP